jgi:thiol-disulfide isomerase/thioredoxin
MKISTLGLAALLAVPMLSQNPHSLSGKAPALTGGPWLNTADGKAPPKAKVTIVHFWTYGCYNCKNNLPSYSRWQKRFAGQDVAMVGVHTPEFAHEADARNVEQQIKKLGVTFPVLLDAQHANWNRWNQQFWPAVYLVDSAGRLRYRWDGELNWRGTQGEEIMARRIEQLLAE